MEERSCGVGQASILRTQGSIQPHVQYVWFCRPFAGFGNKYVTGTMAAKIQMSKCPRDTKRKVCQQMQPELQAFICQFWGKKSECTHPILAHSVYITYCPSMACFSIIVIDPEDAAFNYLFKKQKPTSKLNVLQISGIYK